MNIPPVNARNLARAAMIGVAIFVVMLLLPEGLIAFLCGVVFGAMTWYYLEHTN